MYLQGLTITEFHQGLVVLLWTPWLWNHLKRTFALSPNAVVLWRTNNWTRHGSEESSQIEQRIYMYTSNNISAKNAQIFSQSSVIVEPLAQKTRKYCYLAAIVYSWRGTGNSWHADQQKCWQKEPDVGRHTGERHDESSLRCWGVGWAGWRMALRGLKMKTVGFIRGAQMRIGSRMDVWVTPRNEFVGNAKRTDQRE